MLSSKCKYAIRAVLFLSVQSHISNRLGVKQISEDLKMPAPYTGKILQELSKKEIISSTKGPNGGFYLTKNNLQQPLMKIIETIDGPSFFSTCGLGLTECSDSHPCPIHHTFKISRDHLKVLFESKTIAELSEEIKSTKLFLVR